MRMKHLPTGSLSGRSQFSSQFRKPNSKEVEIPALKKTTAILVIRQTGGIGDILMLTPTIRAIKQANPEVPLIFSTTGSYGGGKGTLFDILKNNPYIDKVISSDKLINYSFKKIYNFGTGREILEELSGNRKNRIDIFADLAEVTLEDKSTVYMIQGSELEWANQWVKKNVNSNRKFLVGIQVHSTNFKRDWPEEKILLLAFTILNSWEDSSILLFYEGLVSTDKIIKHPNIYPIIGMPIRWVAALINECQALVVPDSGLLHLAGALRKKIVSLFGSIPPELRISYYPEATSIYHGLPCSPCWYNKCSRNNECMENISVDMVMDKLCEVTERQTNIKFGKKILVVRMGGVGDLIMLTPSLRSLHKMGSSITVATRLENIPVFENLSYIEKVIPLEEAKNEGSDTIIDLRYRVESPEVGGTLNTKLYTSVNRIDMFSRIIKIDLDSRNVDVGIDAKKVSKVKKLLSYNKKYKYLGIQATCTSNTRTIPPEYIPELVLKLSKIKNLRVIIFGRSEFWSGRISPIDLKEIKGRKIINLIDKIFDVGELVGLCSLMNYLIAPDSSAIHIAGALKIPCIALFGNIDPYLRVNYYKSVIPLWPKGELSCIPCNDFRNPCIAYENLATSIQPISSECMRKLTPERILKVVNENWF